MKVKTQDLTGKALDYAVAITQGWVLKYGIFQGYSKAAAYEKTDKKGISRRHPWQLAYSELWETGGPIIESEGIQLYVDEGRLQWIASCWGFKEAIYGPTPLIAAMRCYVAYKLGSEVDIPEGLCE